MADKITNVIAKEGNGNIQITFTIPETVINKAKDEVIKEYSKETEIPGFRKGMAPTEKVADKIPQNTLIEHSLSHVLPPALADVINDNKLKIAIYPKFELIKAESGEPWQIRAVTCELPDIDLGDYKKVISGIQRSSKLWTPEKGNPKKNNEPSREEKEQLVIKGLLDNIKIDIPQILIDEETDSRISSLLDRLEKLGLALESYLSSTGKKVEDLKEEYSKQAKEAIMLDLILTKIADTENLKIDEKDIDSALNMSQAAKNNDGKTEGDIENRRTLIKSILKRRAALDFLINLS